MRWARETSDGDVQATREGRRNCHVSARKCGPGDSHAPACRPRGRAWTLLSSSDSSTYGITISGSRNAPNVPRAPSFIGGAPWLDNGVETSASEVMSGGLPPCVTNRVSAPISDAEARFFWPFP